MPEIMEVNVRLYELVCDEIAAISSVFFDAGKIPPCFSLAP